MISLLKTKDYQLDFQPGRNIVLMNDGASVWGGLPHHGEMADVNVWSRTSVLRSHWSSSNELQSLAVASNIMP